MLKNFVYISINRHNPNVTDYNYNTIDRLNPKQFDLSNNNKKYEEK